MKKRAPVLDFLINNGIYIVLLLILVFFAASAKGFFTYGNLISIPGQVAFVILIATGMTLVIITGGIDLSVGSIVGLTAVIFAIFVEWLHVPIPAAILVALVGGSLCGVLSGVFVIQFNVPPFIATLAMMTIARGMGRYIAQNTKIFISVPGINTYNSLIMHANVLGIPLLVIFTLVVVAIFGIVLMKTRFGRYVLAVGGNEEAARLSGISVRQTKLAVYVIIAALSSIVGVMMACKFTNGNPEFGVMWELDAIAACVVGGTSLMGGKGNIFKTLLGALIIGVLDNGLNVKGLSSEMIYIIKGVIILGAVIIDQIKSK